MITWNRNNWVASMYSIWFPKFLCNFSFTFFKCFFKRCFKSGDSINETFCLPILNVFGEIKSSVCFPSVKKTVHFGRAFKSLLILQQDLKKVVDNSLRTRCRPVHTFFFKELLFQNENGSFQKLVFVTFTLIAFFNTKTLTLYNMLVSKTYILIKHNKKQFICMCIL